MANILTLNHGQEIYAVQWGKGYTCTVGTVEGYTVANNGNVEAAVQRALKNGHELAYTMNVGTCITDSKGYYEREEAKRATAVPVFAGEHVMIEGREYEVKLVGQRYSDPIHFIAVEA